MSKYSWNIYSLRKIILEYEKKLDFDYSKINTSDEELLDMIDSYQYMLKTFHLKKQLKGINEDYDEYETFDKNISDLEIAKQTFLINSNYLENKIDDVMGNLYIFLRQYKYPKMVIIDNPKINNEELLIIAEKIIKSTENKNFLKLYYQYLKKQHLNIQHLHEDYYYHGICFFDYLRKEIFINLIRNNSTEDIVALVHENFHAIIYHYIDEIGINLEDKSPYLDELEGYLADFISASFLAKTQSFPNIDSIIINDLYDILGYSKKILFGKISLDNLYKNGNINIGKTKESLIKTGIINPYLTRNNKIYYLDKPLLYLSKNCFSLLTALDLFNLYQKDKDLAIYELLEISKLKKDNILKDLRKHHITFMDDNFENLNKTCNKLLQKKKN